MSSKAYTFYIEDDELWLVSPNQVRVCVVDEEDLDGWLATLRKIGGPVKAHLNVLTFATKHSLPAGRAANKLLLDLGIYDRVEFTTN